VQAGIGRPGIHGERSGKQEDIGRSALARATNAGVTTSWTMAADSGNDRLPV